MTQSPEEFKREKVQDFRDRHIGNQPAISGWLYDTLSEAIELGKKQYDDSQYYEGLKKGKEDERRAILQLIPKVKGNIGGRGTAINEIRALIEKRNI